MPHRYITYNDEEDLVIKCPYNAQFVSLLKDLVDKDSRKWDAYDKTWTVDAAYEEQIIKLLVKHYPSRPSDEKRYTTSRTAYYELFPQRSRNPNPTAEQIRRRQQATPDPDPAKRVDKIRVIDPNTGEIIEKKVTKPSRAEMEETIRDLTGQVSTSKYELENARRNLRAAEERATRAGAGRATLERTIAELRFKLTMAEASNRSAGETPPNSDPNRPYGWDSYNFSGAGPGTSFNAEHYKTLHLDPSAPPSLVEATRRSLASLYHPDRPGGDEAKMKAVNKAADAILGK